MSQILIETRLVGRAERKSLNEIEKLLLNTIVSLKTNYAIMSERAYCNKRLFHSKSYNRKGNSNSYTISYLDDLKKSYGDIEYFLQIGNKILAVVTKHEILENNNFLPDSCGFFFEIVSKYIFNYFQLIKFTNSLNIINVNSIKNRCIIIETEDKTFITELEYEFEHD